MPDGLLYSGRVPSWKAVALAILRNDLTLSSLGFSGAHSGYAAMLERINSDQYDLFH